MTSVWSITCDGCGKVLRSPDGGDGDPVVDLSISDMAKPLLPDEDQYRSWDLCRDCAGDVRAMLVQRYGKGHQ